MDAFTSVTSVFFVHIVHRNIDLGFLAKSNEKALVILYFRALSLTKYYFILTIIGFIIVNVLKDFIVLRGGIFQIKSSMRKHKKINLSGLNKSRILGMVFLIITVLSAVLAGVCSHFLPQIYKMPIIEKGKLDMQQREEWIVLPGEWEYYYNKWLITDNLADAEPDGFLSMPDVWTDKVTNDGQKLTKNGYGSFRITVENAKPNLEVLIFANNYDGAYRTFINGVLNVEYGTMSKEISETKSNGRADNYYPYKVSEGEILEVVVEISNNNEGGMHYAFYLRSDFTANQTMIGDQISLIILGVLFALFIISIVINLIQKERRMWSMTFILMFIFSIDILYLFCLSLNTLTYNCIAEVFYAIAIVTVISFMFHLHKMNILNPPNKANVIIFSTINIACIAAFYSLSGYKERIIPVAIQLLCTMLLYFPIFRAVFNKVKFAKAYVAVLFGILMLIGAQLFDMLEIVILGTESFASGALGVIMLAIFTINFIRISDKNNEALQAETYKRRLVEIKNSVLREQIKPHFVFNSLSSIKSIYHNDLEDGDKAILSFASHLRAIIDADAKPMITLEEEIDNIINYVSLVDLGLGKSINLLLDIDESKCCVPMLSLQPFIENAIKHSGVILKDDGFILIKTESDGAGGVIVTIEDNGCGFDINSVEGKSVGLRNAMERIKFTLATDVQIDSAVGKGTVIKILVPKGRGNK